MKKANIVALFVIVPILLGVIAVGLYIGFTFDRYGESGGPEIVRGTIQRSTITDAQGNPRQIEARVAFKVDPDAGGISRQQLDQAVNNALSRLVFEEMAAENGLDHVRGMIRGVLELDPSINADAIGAIYVVDFASDFELPPDTIPRPDGMQQMFDGLFGGGGRR